MNAWLICIMVAGLYPQNATSTTGTFTPGYLPDYDYISIAGYCFNPSEKLPEIPAGLEGTSDYYLIHLRGPIYEDMKKLIESYGIELIQYVPFNAYIARMNSSAKTIVEQLPFVNWIGNYEPAYKLSPLFDQLRDEKRMLVQLFHDENLHSVTRKLKSIGCEILEVSENGCDRIIKLSTERSNLAAIARFSEVMYVEPWLEPVAYNVSAQWVTETWKQACRRIWAKGLYGAGQIVNTADTGILTSHNFFRDPAVSITTWGNYPTHRKIIAYQTWTGSTAAFGDNAGGSWHGTHTAGTISGDDSYVGGISDKDGMPPKDKMWFMDIGDAGGALSVPGDLNTLYQPAFSGGARVSSHSWGNTSGNGTYTLNCRNTDMFMWNNKEFLICFAAGNGGPGAGTVMPPGTSKDIITAGSVQNGTAAVNVSSFSSRGPCQDTRLKPTVTAPGEFLWSSAGPNDNSMLGMAGTSMATPCIAGNAALVRNYFAKGFYPTGDSTPANQWSFIPAALVKACIVNSAHPQIAGSTIPDNNTGWGRVCLDDVLYFSGDVRKLQADTNNVMTGTFREYIVAVNNQSEPLKITLVWTDYYAAASANPAIINDLDLYVIGPTGTYYAGNRYSGGQSVPNDTTWDNRNVEENVRINTPALGNYTIRARGRNVPQGPQQFALVTSGGLGPVASAVLHIIGSLVQDPSPANQNGRLDAGETVYLTDTLKNLSGVAVSSCLGTLRTASTYITLLDSVGNFGNIAIGGTGHNGASRFRFTASASTPPGTWIPFTLHLTGTGGYTQDIGFDMLVGISEVVIIWGPKPVQIAASDTQFLYGLTYNTLNDRIYVTNAYERNIYIYSSDSNVTYFGAIPAPDTFTSDIKYCAYDNTFWVASDWSQAYPNGKRVFKINTTGTVLRQFANPANDYPTGLAWLEPQRLLYLADRRAQNATPQYIYRSDTLGTATQLILGHTGNVGPRGLAREPYGQDTTLLMVYTWFTFDATPLLDSTCLYELRRSDLAILNRLQLPGWNVRGVEYDPRDGNYWLTIPQNPGRSIVKILGFHGIPIGINETQAENILGKIALLPSYPNPFSRVVRISYSIPTKMKVKLNLYDVVGCLVTTLVDRVEGPGLKTIVWDGRTEDGNSFASGVYFYRLDTEQGSLVRKLVYTR